MIPPTIRALTRLAQLTLTLTFTLTLGAAEQQDPAAIIESQPRVDPMDTTGLDYGVANILRNYYRKTFTDAATWEQIESIRFDGTLQLPQGIAQFTAFKKKPDLCRIVLTTPNGGRVIMAYDGSDAWQQQSSRVGSAARQPSLSEATTMPAAEARNFIRDATTGGHLLYPLMPGKTITIEGTPTVDGQRTYHLRIQLPDGQQLQSFLDMTSFAEVRQITINNVNGKEEVTTHSDFRFIDGIRFPFNSTLTVDGQQMHQVSMQRVQTNQGVAPWMFTRPTAAEQPDSFKLDEQIPTISEAPTESWGAKDIWAPSVFTDPAPLNTESFGLPSNKPSK